MSFSIPLSSGPDAVSVRVPGGEQAEKQPRPEILFSLHIQNLRGHVLFTQGDKEHTSARRRARAERKEGTVAVRMAAFEVQGHVRMSKTQDTFRDKI